MSDLDKSGPPGCFTTTKWTLVIKAIQEGNETVAAQALDDFCRQYREAICGYIRRRGYSHERAEDLVQEFLQSKLLQKSSERTSFVHRAQRGVGQFRSFLCHVVVRFLQDKTRGEATISGGGQVEHVSAEVLAESGHVLPGTVEAECAREFDVEYARTVIQLAVRNLKHANHHLAVLTGKKTHAEVARELGMTEPTFRVSHLRFRQRFGEAIRDEVKSAVGDDENEVNEELRYLMTLFEKAL
jgi:DNA-directed RNA polymerase specialized sigma24 family protein